MQKRLFRRPSRTGTTAMVAGAAFLTSWATLHGAWTNPLLWVTAIVASATLPAFGRWVQKAEMWACWATAAVTPGLLARYAIQVAYNGVLVGALVLAGVLDLDELAAMGGPLVAILAITAAGQGMQMLALRWARRRGGHEVTAVVTALAVNAAASATGALGVPLLAQAYVAFSLAVWIAAAARSILSDAMAFIAPKGGIAVFFGTFNPVHVAHLDLVRRVLDERGVEAVIIHPTLVPKFHRDALARGEIRIRNRDGGYIEYETTDRADPHIDYFPTGRRFLDPEDRRRLLEVAVADAGLSDRVFVAWHPEAYDKDGFPGVLREIRSQWPGRRVHVVHGSDWGGMMVRRLLDDGAWVWPFAVRRRGAVSATAVRAGALHFLSEGVVRELERIAARPTQAAKGRVHA